MRAFFGTLGLIGLVLAMVVGMFAAFGAFGEKVTLSSPTAELDALPEQTVQSEPTTAARTGEAVTTGDVSWTVSDASRESELRRYTFPPKTFPGDYVSIDFTVENVSDEPVTLNDETITLVDSKGNEYRAEAARNNAVVEPDKNLLFGEESLLEPGETKEGKVNFEVLAASSGFKALLGGTDPTVSERRAVDLGL